LTSGSFKLESKVNLMISTHQLSNVILTFDHPPIRVT
jgi:hypothetical protein